MNRLERERPRVTHLEASYFVRMGARLALEWASDDGSHGTLTPTRQIAIMQTLEEVGHGTVQRRKA